MTTSEQQPLFLGSKGGHCFKVWRYVIYIMVIS